MSKSIESEESEVRSGNGRKPKLLKRRFKGSLHDGWTVDRWVYGPPVTKNGPHAWLVSPDGFWVLLVKENEAMLRPSDSVSPKKVSTGELSQADYASGWLRSEVPRAEGLSAIPAMDAQVSAAIRWAQLPETIDRACALKQGKGAAEANAKG